MRNPVLVCSECSAAYTINDDHRCSVTDLYYFQSCGHPLSEPRCLPGRCPIRRVEKHARGMAILSGLPYFVKLEI